MSFKNANIQAFKKKVQNHFSKQQANHSLNQCITENLEYLHFFNTVEVFGGEVWIKFPENT